MCVNMYKFLYRHIYLYHVVYVHNSYITRTINYLITLSMHAITAILVCFDVSVMFELY